MKVEKMRLSNIHVLMFALNPFTPRRSKYIKLFPFTILIQSYVGRYRELKKNQPRYIVFTQLQIFSTSSDLSSGRTRT